MKIFILIIATIQISRVSLSLSWPNFYVFPPKATSNSTQLKSLPNETVIKTIFLVHGYKNSHLKRGLQHLKEELNKHIDNANVILVDWKEGAAPKISLKDLINYDNAARNTRIVGKSIADYIKSNNIDPKTVHCIGHSLGAHCCGFAAKNLTNLGRISAIDPAGPLFEKKPANERLDKSDAQFVDCIFTTNLSFDEPFCHANFYPDSQMGQKMCGFFGFTRFSCNHGAGVWYYASSVDYSTCKFAATKCNSLEEFKKHKCLCKLGNSTDIDTCSQNMGFFANPNALGNFYLETKKDKPYCLN